MAVKVKNVPMGAHQEMLEYLANVLSWGIDVQATTDLITICPLEGSVAVLVLHLDPS